MLTTPPPLIIHGDYQMGRYRSSMPLSTAQGVFGAPTSMHPGQGIQAIVCRVRWAKYNLLITFDGCKPESHFIRFIATNPRWETARGLRVGAPVSQIRRLYPDATHTVVGKQVRWSLYRRPGGSTPTLAAWAMHGKVQALTVRRGNSGLVIWN